MDPLYANLDKRNSSADQPKPQAPQPTAYSMPNFGQPGTSSVTTTGPIVSSPEPATPAKPIISTEPVKPATPIEPTTPVSTQPIMSAPTEPITPKPVVSGSGDIILNIDQPKKKSKGIAAAIITIVAVALVGCGGFILYQYLSHETEANTAALRETISSRLDSINNLQIIITTAQEENLTVNDMVNESSSESIARYMNDVVALKNDISNLNGKKFSDDVKTQVNELSSWLGTDIAAFELDVNQYNKFYSVFLGEDDDMSELPKELIEYFDNLGSIVKKLKENKCGEEQDNKQCDTIAENLQNEYERTDVAKYVFSKSIEHDYYEAINQLIVKIDTEAK